MTTDASARAVLHIGAPKTGSTFLQGLLWRNRAALAHQGLEMLGHAQAQHYRAGKDLRNIPFDPADPGVDWTGAWDRMADRAANSNASIVVVSDEHLASATAVDVQRAVASLAPRQVHVVYVIRDLVSLLPSEWQEFVKHGSTLTYNEWAQRLFDSPEESPGAWFWSVHDPVSVVERWTSAVPGEQMHVIGMPASSAPRDELWRRFASVTDVDPKAVTDFDVQANASLGPISTEVLRQVNERLAPELAPWHRTVLVRDVLANQILQGLDDRGRPALEPDLSDRAVKKAAELRAGLAERGVRVVGQVDPSQRLTRGSSWQPNADEVSEASVSALAELVAHMAADRDRCITTTANAVSAALAEHEAEYQRRHPVSARLDGLRDRAVTAADTSHAAAAALDQYRRLRALLAPGRS